MITEEQAKAAQRKLLDDLNRLPWVRGIGVVSVETCPDGSYGLVVYVDQITDAVRGRVPTSLDDIPVRMVRVG